MRTLRSFLCVILLSIGVLPSAVACSCVKRSVEQHFADAASVFVGRVVSTKEVRTRSDQPGWGGVAGRFTLLKPIKGNVKSLATVESGYGGGDCGVPLLVGTTYIFFAGAKGAVNICSGTQSYVAGYEPHESTLKRLKQLGASAR